MPNEQPVEQIPAAFEDWISDWLKENVVSAPDDLDNHVAKVVWARAIAIDIYLHVSSQLRSQAPSSSEIRQDDRLEIAQILENGIHFSEQVKSFAVHGAIDKIIEWKNKRLGELSPVLRYSREQLKEAQAGSMTKESVISFANWRFENFIKLSNGGWRIPFPDMGKGPGDATEYTDEHLYDLWLKSITVPEAAPSSPTEAGLLDRLTDMLSRAQTYLEEMNNSNTHDPSVGLYRDEHLVELVNDIEEYFLDRRPAAPSSMGEEKGEIQECNTEKGTTVGLIDSLITISKVVRDRDLSDPEIGKALADLRASDNMNAIMDIGDLSSAKEYIEDQKKSIEALTAALAFANSLLKNANPPTDSTDNLKNK